MAANSPNSTQAMIDSYRNLVKIRANFDNLITTVNKIGQLDNQTSELETKVDQELARVSANNFDRIRADLAEVQEDNNRLISQLKALRK
jgi:Asp-tRNA(Asn)/Glu-tRNA(Gln) amidotransferase C subunit